MMQRAGAGLLRADDQEIRTSMESETNKRGVRARLEAV
jgi:hypothetical protein